MLSLIQSVSRSQIRSAHILPVESQRSQMSTTLQAVMEPVYIIIHTDREVQIEWREEIGINRLIVTLVTMRKLSLTNQLDGIIPLLGSLQTEFSGVSNHIIARFQRMNRITLRSLITQTHLQFIIPFHLLLVIVVGKHRHSSEHRIITLTTLIPVVRNIILQELEIIIATYGPEVRTGDDDIHRSRIHLNRLRSHLLYDVRMILLRFALRSQRCPHLLEMSLCIAHQVGTREINLHQSLIEHRSERILHPILRFESQHACCRTMIERERCEELSISAILRIHLHGIDALTALQERIGIDFSQPVLRCLSSLHLLQFALGRNRRQSRKERKNEYSKFYFHTLIL